MQHRPVSARRSLGIFLFVATVLGSIAAACGPADTDVGPRPPCPADAGTCATTSGGAGSAGGGQGGGGSGGGGQLSDDVRGSVGVLNSPSFSTISPYAGAATIFAPSKSGAPMQAPYGETQSFELADVMSGRTWFFVRDETVGATGILSTHSVLSVPTGSDVMLPVLDRNLLGSIAGMLPAPTTLQDGKAQLVLLFVRNGQPLSGVSVSTALPGAVMAYDEGIGLYSNQTTLTGPAGVALVLNVDAPVQAELRNLTLTDVNGLGYMIQLPVQSNAATFAAFEL
ncbi:hypothetical protein [Polyangium aurulentum]|uniref:hypothetical protein n=1 Tax=Polyangium aurulentum TaxID=2567896 RepID=UPI0010ADC297|nr:hypothetical protein [Polyangium aurulentum]UQA56581.1 hypothetical protein E8A73_035520 [Polyangium aurulentum]